MGIIGMQRPPRTGVVETDTPDILIPALARLRECQDSIDVLRLCDQLPDGLIPHLAWASSRRRTTPSWVIALLVKYCGDVFLERSLGQLRLRQLKLRCPATQALSGL
jgi:hypothetical protein